jgi:Domain of unknown function (DUF4388)
MPFGSLGGAAIFSDAVRSPRTAYQVPTGWADSSSWADVGRISVRPVLHARPAFAGRVGVGMSLVGNLEDLSLGDIMQIISLSQKFGVLALESERGSGRIVFSSGQVRGACLKGVEGHFSDLRSLVVGKGILDPAGFDACESHAADLGLTVEEMLRSEASLDIERIDALISEAVQAAVLEMFTWPSGDFSFDVREDGEEADPQLLVKAGINSQYLAMEGMRMRDERERGGSRSGSDGGSGEAAPVGEMSAHEMFGVEDGLALDEDLAADDDSELELTEIVDDLDIGPGAAPIDDSLMDFEEDLEGGNETTATDIVVAAVLENEVGGGIEPLHVHARPLILIDPDVAVLEWAKLALREKFRHVHVFQQAEQGLMRIRQYLIRGELPVVLISPDAEVDPLSGIRGLGDFVKRLKAQAVKLPIFGLVESDELPTGAPGSHLDGILARPARLRMPGDSGAEVDPAAHSLAAALDDLLSDRALST